MQSAKGDVEVKVEVVSLSPDGTWRSVFLRSVDQVIGLEALDLELPLGEVYADIEFGPAGNEALEA